MKITFKEIIKEFNINPDKQGVFEFIIPGSPNKQSEDKFYWLKNESYYDKFEIGYIIISQNDYNLLKATFRINEKLIHLITNEKPRLLFALIVNKYFVNQISFFNNEVDKHLTNKSILIAANVFIGENVNIGEGTVIYPNVVINKNTTIGKNCVIKENCTIATEGLGYEMFEGKLVKFPQIGGVVIGDNVEMGPHATIRRAALDSTIIGSGTKIGSFVNIGHNSIIGENAIFTCQCVISGSSIIGDNLFMGVQSSTRHGVKLGNNITIGHGAVITKNFGDDLILIGNPAEPIQDFKKWSEIRKKLMSESVV